MGHFRMSGIFADVLAFGTGLRRSTCIFEYVLYSLKKQHTFRAYNSMLTF